MFIGLKRENEIQKMKNRKQIQINFRFRGSFLGDKIIYILLNLIKNQTRNSLLFYYFIIRSR
jgi:hypothetical protein